MDPKSGLCAVSGQLAGSRLQLRLDVSTLTDARQPVRDGNGNVPNRYQSGYLDAVGRTVAVSLRKRF